MTNNRLRYERRLLGLIGEAGYADRMEGIRYVVRATTLEPKRARKLLATLRNAEHIWSTRNEPQAAATEGATTR